MKSPITKSKPAPTKSSSKPKINPIASTLNFYMDDIGKTLFPLKTNRELVQRGESEIKGYIGKCLDESDAYHFFLPQRRVYAAKPEKYLRRTVKLDPVSEYYIYDIIYRNRSLFKKPHTKRSEHYGYRFESGSPIAPTAAYKGFKGAIAEYTKNYAHFISLDVSAYFNSVYHHDIISWFAELGASNPDVDGLGQFFRELNYGRSLDCLPQGLYPTKMIGNDFLRYIDNHHAIKSEKLIRFMDDIYIFSNNRNHIDQDFQTIQRLLGEKGLSLNQRKTSSQTASHVNVEHEIDEVKRELLKRRRMIVADGYDEIGEELVKEVMLKWPLNEKEISYIDAILQKPDIEEEDAELILTIMRANAGKVESRLPYILRQFPHLTKNVFNFVSALDSKMTVASVVLNIASENPYLMENQLFWFGWMLDEFFLDTPQAASLVDVLFNHPSSTTITKAKILEIADNRYGLADLRNDYLVSGQSDWLAWSSAVGSRNLKPITLNHKLKYFGKSSNMNHLVAVILSK